MERERLLGLQRAASERDKADATRADRRAQLTKLAASVGVDMPLPPPPSSNPIAPREVHESRKARRFRDRAERTELERAEHFERARQGDEKYIERVREKYAAEGRATPVGMSRASFLMAADMAADHSGRAVRIWLWRCRNKPLVGAIRQAALAPDPETGVCRYDWRDARARNIARVALVLHAHATVTRRERGASWGLCVRGITRGALAAWLRDPFTGARPASTTLTGTHRLGGSYLNGQVGWLKALNDTDALYSVQPPPEACAPWEIWPAKKWSGGVFIPTTNQWWLRAPLPSMSMSSAELERLAELAAIGCDAHTEEISRRPRRKALALEAPASQAPP